MRNAKENFNFHEISNGKESRRIAFDEFGDNQAPVIFLCLPGILETRKSFQDFCKILCSKLIVRIINPDYCGRGDSSPLKKSVSYKMSTYLQDLQVLLNGYVFKSHLYSNYSFYIVGNSMGGILALHLTKNLKQPVKALILNDIGLSLKWHSIINLYGNLKAKTQEIGLSSIAKKLDVNEFVIQDVNSPSHFDLEYDYDMSGMYFDSLLKKFKGAVVLIHSEQSSVCPPSIAQKSKSLFPELITRSDSGQNHPVDWNSDNIQWLVDTLNLNSIHEPQSIPTIQQSIKQPKSFTFETLQTLNDVKTYDSQSQSKSNCDALFLKATDEPQYLDKEQTLNHSIHQDGDAHPKGLKKDLDQLIIDTFLQTSETYLWNTQELKSTSKSRLGLFFKKISELTKSAWLTKP